MARRPSPDEEANYIARIRQIVEQAETYGQPSSIADARASLGIALRSSEPAAALTLLEDALDLCAPLGVEETSNTARCELASHYTQLGRPRDALALMRTTIPDHIRVGAWHEVCTQPSLTPPKRSPTSVALASPRPSSDGSAPATSEFNQNYHGFRPFTTNSSRSSAPPTSPPWSTSSRSRTLADVAQLAIETIDEIVD